MFEGRLGSGELGLRRELVVGKWAFVPGSIAGRWPSYGPSSYGVVSLLVAVWCRGGAVGVGGGVLADVVVVVRSWV